ncbi:hypothetical protein [Streptomyces sp. SID3343]|uniref:hypothetical protein n=1 Tax=Streptomyces sp. SID3343 TaxID=2690260 RepID=UPI001F40AF39|nr:hypothetical protein [Streptomyces sp. SID3343]
MLVTRRLGEDYLHIVTAGRAVAARHHRVPRGGGQSIRDAGHVIALERAVLESFTDREPCRTKIRRPLAQAALEEADRLRNASSGASSAKRVVIDMSAYTADRRGQGGDQPGMATSAGRQVQAGGNRGHSRTMPRRIRRCLPFS